MIHERAMRAQHASELAGCADGDQQEAVRRFLRLNAGLAIGAAEATLPRLTLSVVSPRMRCLTQCRAYEGCVSQYARPHVPQPSTATWHGSAAPAIRASLGAGTA